MDFGIATVVPIAVLCFLGGQLIKNWTSLDNKRIPSICAVAGGVLGIVAMYTMPDFPANDWITAAAVGIMSGLSATGAHQVYKQGKG